MKQNKITKKTKKQNRRTRKTVKIGGTLATNIVRGITNDKELSKNYHETIIKVEDEDYLVRYIVPDHFLFKNPDQIFKNPEFEAVLSGKPYKKCIFTIEDKKSQNHNITMFVKIQSKKNPASFYWFAVIDSGNQIIQSGKLFNYVFYSIKEKKCEINNNDSNVISINKMYEKKDCKDDKCTVILVNGKDGSVELLSKKSIYQKILFNFFIQQQAQTEIKEDGMIVAADAGVGLLDWLE
jgi:hypothetical protein